jgi:acetyl-CoA carboxylase biotin carboxyl carrier protein
MEPKLRTGPAAAGNSPSGSPHDTEGGAYEGMLPLEEIGRLVDLLRQGGVSEIHVKLGELEVAVRVLCDVAADPPQHTVLGDSRETTDVADPRIVERDMKRSGLHEVTSPVVGTFYRAPAPGEEPYAKVGDQVKAGQTLCIVEAMKLMNEIPADVSGEVVEVLAENAQGVEYDQPLFRLRSES